MLSAFCNAICNLQFAIFIFDFYLISLLRPISTGLYNTAQNTALLSNFTMLLAYCTIACSLAMQPCPGSFARQPCPASLPSSLARQPCTVALHGSLARQPCPAALTGSLARQPCPAALTSSLARQPCPAALPGSLARQPCPPALPASLARQPCPPALPTSLAEKFASCFTAVGRYVCMQYCILLLGRQFSFEPCVRIDIDL
jgi:hypothetical protein